MGKKKNKKNKKIRKSNLQMIYTNDARKLHRRYAYLEKKAVDEYKLSASRQMANNLFQQLFIDTLGIPLLALRNRGYGKKRLEEVFNETMTIFKDYHEERFTFDDVSGIIKEETGIDFTQAKEVLLTGLGIKQKRMKDLTNTCLFTQWMRCKMEEKLYKLIDIVKGESVGTLYKGVKKITFEYKNKDYVLTENMLYPLEQTIGIDNGLTSSLVDVRVKLMEF